MNWAAAMAMALRNHTLNRVSLMAHEVDGNTTYMGEEGFKIMYGWSHEDTPVTVFVGAQSKCLFIPTEEDKKALDWIITE